MVYVGSVGIKHWIFTMKHWKLSLTVSQLVGGSKPHLLQHLETPIYYTAIILNILLPASMFFLIAYTKFYTIMQALYYTWLLLFVSSLYFLIDAYLRLNTIVCDVIKGSVN